MEEYQTKAILAGLRTTQDEASFERSMNELSMLAKTAGIEAVHEVVQRADTPVKATYIGRGKLTELKGAAAGLEADLVIFDQQLTPMQFKNLGEELETEVMDRTGLILKIFSEQARTREAKLQVEHARLQYLLPRLAGMWTHFGRQGGTSGSQSNRGVGETQIELDRRHIERRMNELEKELKQVDRERATQREKRLRSGLPRIALVGYTNAGKSTLMNRLLELSDLSPSDKEEKQVRVKNALFVTLDSTVRRIGIPGRHPFLLSDTVGFINELPHSLVKAFRSTLEEVKYADILLQVIDVSDPLYEICEKVTEETLEEIDAAAIPMIRVYNKTDLAYGGDWQPRRARGRVYLSAAAENDMLRDKGVDLLLSAIEDCLRENRQRCTLLFPYKEGAVLRRLQENGDIESCEYLPEGVLAKAMLGREDLGRLEKFRVQENT